MENNEKLPFHFQREESSVGTSVVASSLLSENTEWNAFRSEATPSFPSICFFQKAQWSEYANQGEGTGCRRQKNTKQQYLKQLQEWKSWSNLKEQLPQSGTEAETERELAFPLEEIIRKKQVLLCPQTSMVSMVCLCIPSSLQPLVIKGLYCALQW